MSDEKDNPDATKPPAVPAVEVASDDAPVTRGVDDVAASEKSDNKPDTMGTGEVTDRAEKRRIAAEKKAAAAEAKKKTKDEVSDALRQGRLAKKKKAKIKKQMRVAMALAAIGLGYLLYGFLFSSPQAGITYGICRVYIENNVRFPKHLKFVGLEDFGDNVRLWYSRIDAFGGQRIETARCYYVWDEAIGSSKVDKITINRREEPTHKIDSFNTVLPVVLENLPNLDWPFPVSDKNLDNIEVDGTAARQPVL